MDWYAVLPRGEAKLQTGWEKRQRVLCAIRAGATRQEIATHLGCSYNHVRLMHNKAQSRWDRIAPVERYLRRRAQAPGTQAQCGWYGSVNGSRADEVLPVHPAPG